MRKQIKRVSALLAAILTTSFVAGCGEGTNDGNGEPMKVWSAYSTAKILRDTDYGEEYTSKAAKLTVDTVRNEYETAQFVATAGSDKVDSYTVTLSDLTDGAGNVYSKENVVAYSALYARVYTLWNDGNGMMPGDYPDGMLETEKEVAAKENYIEAGQNQSFYFSFFTPKDQAAGTYTGSFTLTADGKEYTIPVSVTVRDLTLADEVRSRSIFLTDWSYYIGEYNSSQDMLDTYNKALIKYRLAPHVLTNDFISTEEDAEYYAEKAYELCHDYGMTNFSLPTSTLGASFINKDSLVLFIEGVFKKSLEKNYNLMDKAYVYCIDEPEANNMFNANKVTYEAYKAAQSQATETLLKKKSEYIEQYGVSEEFFDEVLADIANVRNVVTTAYSEGYAPYVDTWCPYVSDYETVNYEEYAKKPERWWYTCLQPKYPYPTLHVDDYLVSSRVMGWMMSEYDVRGNLYWAVNIYAKYDSKGYQFCDDYYSDAAHFNTVNGDGFLFYPGAKYGIDGPIPTIRIDSLRDGLEEYELLEEIKDAYEACSEEIGIDFHADDFIKNITSSLYFGTAVGATDETFAAARAQLLDLAQFTSLGVYFTDYEDDNKGNLRYNVYVPDGTQFTASGLEKVSERAVTGGKEYSYKADLQTATGGKVTFEAEKDGKNAAISFEIAGGVERIDATSLLSQLSGNLNTAETLVVNGDALGQSASEKFVHLSLTASGKNTYQILKIGSAVASKIDSSLSKAIFSLYFDQPADTKLKVTLTVKYKKKSYEQEIYAGELVGGHNQITWANLDTKNWSATGEVERISVWFGEKGAAARQDIYLQDVVLYKAKGGK